MRGVVGRGCGLLVCGSHARRGGRDGIGGGSRGFGRRSDDARRRALVEPGKGEDGGDERSVGVVRLDQEAAARACGVQQVRCDAVPYAADSRAREASGVYCGLGRARHQSVASMADGVARVGEGREGQGAVAREEKGVRGDHGTPGGVGEEEEEDRRYAAPASQLTRV